ncbi:hypothetical protein SGQ83_19675 [Flavobacterium sp. Fl-318]|uniref:Phage major capsid protein n=1 Tax=Flavobacterium cupriresistens TaxID=2893885 RepID=A0ABU4RG71_9FLAO|nr:MULTISPECIES: hypothetical protein [unclassified Flavobacterium]MDX6191584.1 hypothetical protein [Flavobacterium sp. Fl-318]UFH41531.1 hypothetical protein LNP23_17140 [Flavobacterium sp. F-323]
MNTLNKQVWISQIMENFYPEASFLNYAKDMTEFVENDKINLADCGFDPDVYINNTTYPIPIVQRTDTPLSLELDLYETENTLVRSPEAVELAYDKLESVIYGHRNTLRAKSGQKAAHAYAPNSNTENTPILVTTGADNGEGYKRLAPEDILKLKKKYDLLDIPFEKRYLVLDPNHVEDLILYDLKAFKDITDFVNGQPNRFAGFNILQYTKTPRYNFLTKEKIPFGAVEDANTTFGSFSFSSEEVMKADGSVNMFERINDPELRATIVGFDKRFLALPIRNKALGAIISSKI